MPTARPILLVSLVAAVSACAPPPAPEGLDDAASYLVREFYSSDAKFQAGIQGFVDWFELGNPNAEPVPEAPGKEILGLAPGQEGKETDAFTVDVLSAADLDHLPLLDQVLQYVENGEEVRAPRDESLALGVVSLVEMDCTFDVVEALLVRRDQDNVFRLEWDSYDRAYVPSDASRTAYEDAMANETFDPIREDLAPFNADGSFAPDFDPTDYDGTILFTDNVVDPAPIEFNINLTAYDLNLDLRHGIYDLEITDTETGERGFKSQRAFAILTYNPDAVYLKDNYSTGLRQSYSMEVVLERPNGKSLRMVAVWAEPVNPLAGIGQNIILNGAIRKSIASSTRLAEICEGTVEIDAE